MTLGDMLVICLLIAIAVVAGYGKALATRVGRVLDDIAERWDSQPCRCSGCRRVRRQNRIEARQAPGSQETLDELLLEHAARFGNPRPPPVSPHSFLKKGL